MDKSDYKHISIRGDGNCLFNSISKFLELDKYLDNDIHVIKPNQLRKLTVQWIRKNLSYRTPSGLTITDDIIEYILNDDDEFVEVDPPYYELPVGEIEKVLPPGYNGNFIL